MRRIPEETDRLMWLVAEENDPRAVEEFGDRFPELRPELVKRIQVVRAIKGARSSLAEPKAIPRFVPPERGRPAHARVAWVTAAIALIALGYGSFAVSKRLFTHAPRPMPEASSDREVRAASHNESFGPSPRKLPEEPPTAPLAPPPTERDEGPPPAVRLSLRFERIALLDALQRIGKRCGVEILVAPGMPNPDIVLDYRNMTAAEMLSDMGPRFGFTAFEQDDGSLLVIPARDSAEAGGVPPLDVRPPERHPMGDQAGGSSPTSER